MLKENSRLLEILSRSFLEEYDLDRAYFKTVRIIRRLNDKGIEVSMKEVQREAYRCEEVGK